MTGVRVPESAIGKSGSAYVEAMAAVTDERRTQWPAHDLLAEVFPEPRWAVPNLLAEGLNLLAGPPKVGKSWAALGLAVAVASGGRAFGSIPVDAGPVLYLALEDPPRRLQSRLRTLLAEDSAPDGLHLWTECDRLPEGAEKITGWLDEHPEARLVVVDVFARMRPPADPKASSYDADYASTFRLKQIADDYGVCVLLVHHTRKQAADDWLDTISGTQGLAGGVDALLVLRRQRGAATAELLVTGRDIEEAKYALNFAPDLGTWNMLDGPADDYTLGETRRRIVLYLRDVKAATPKQIAEALDLHEPNVRQTVRRMVDDDQLDTDGSGTYLDLSHLSPESLSDSDSGDTSDTSPGEEG